MIPKFRAWDKDNKKMYDQNSIVFIDYEHGLGVQKLYYEGSIAVERDIDTFGFVCIDLMQSTGLKDKNGVEIFEGDIVTGLDYDLNPLKGKIVFKYSCFLIESEEGDYIILNDAEIEVIGNIYENKELLE